SHAAIGICQVEAWIDWINRPMGLIRLSSEMARSHTEYSRFALGSHDILFPIKGRAEIRKSHPKTAKQ
ncbi:hypothetical protein, partial [Pseudooceanicola sp. MF1-13]|uniref:hypothetical protein n=1 Tax=Pseudooceanicola sp. MF1-13 TaxID=3379095 RepID=UPI0038923021